MDLQRQIDEAAARAREGFLRGNFAQAKAAEAELDAEIAEAEAEVARAMERAAQAKRRRLAASEAKERFEFMIASPLMQQVLAPGAIYFKEQQLGPLLTTPELLRLSQATRVLPMTRERALLKSIDEAIVRQKAFRKAPIPFVFNEDDDEDSYEEQKSQNRRRVVKQRRLQVIQYFDSMPKSLFDLMIAKARENAAKPGAVEAAFTRYKLRQLMKIARDVPDENLTYENFTFPTSIPAIIQEEDDEVNTPLADRLVDAYAKVPPQPDLERVIELFMFLAKNEPRGEMSTLKYSIAKTDIPLPVTDANLSFFRDIDEKDYFTRIRDPRNEFDWYKAAAIASFFNMPFSSQEELEAAVPFEKLQDPPLAYLDNPANEAMKRSLVSRAWTELIHVLFSSEIPTEVFVKYFQAIPVRLDLRQVANVRDNMDDEERRKYSEKLTAVRNSRLSDVALESLNSIP